MDGGRSPFILTARWVCYLPDKLEVVILLQQGQFFHSDYVLVIAFCISNT